MLNIYFADAKREINIDERPCVKVGNLPSCDVAVQSRLPKMLVKINKAQSGVKIKANVPITIDGKKTKRGLITPDSSCIISRSPPIAATVYIKRSDSPRIVDLSGTASIQIGRGANNNVVLNNNKVSESHAVIIKRV